MIETYIAEIARLTRALRLAHEELNDMLPYVDEYFVDKWGYRDSIEQVRAALEDGREVME